MNTCCYFTISCIILVSIGKYVTPLPTSESTGAASSRPIVIVVSFDGFRHSYISPSRTPILTNLTVSGATVPYLVPSFPSKTFPNHHSIATGLYPSFHGIVNNIIFDPKYAAVINGKSDDPRFWNYKDTVIPLWIQNELNGGISGCVMWPGCSFGYGSEFKLFPTYYYPKYNKKLTWESRVKDAISWITDESKPANLVFMYYHEPDNTGHKYGPNDPRTLESVLEADRRFGTLIEALKLEGIYDSVNLVLLSDHGMSEVKVANTLGLDELLDEDLVANVYDTGPLMHIVPETGKEMELLETLKNISSSKHLSVLEKKDLCREPFYYCVSRRIHDYVVLSDPGWNLQGFHESRSGLPQVYGTHGYANTLPSMRVFMVANGPAFKTGYVTETPARNVDVVPLLSKLLGIPNVPSNGSLLRLEGMLKLP